MIELCFASDGIVIGNREKKNAIDLSYSEMFRVVHDFMNECYRRQLITQDDDKVALVRLKQGDGSPYPIIVSGINGSKQLKYEEIIGLTITD